MRSLWAPVVDARFYAAAAAPLAQSARGVCLTGLVPGARALVVALLAAGTKRRLLLVTPDDTTLEAWSRDLTALAPLTGLGPARIAVFPALDADPYDAIAPHPEVLAERVAALNALRGAALDILLVPARGLLHPLPSADAWRAWTTVVRVGADLAPETFVLRAMSLGYRRVDIVGGAGEVSRRGGIIDIFPPTAREPVRIELFGDEVESLRAFDTDNQRSTGRLDEVVVGPAVENPPTEEAVRRLTDLLESRRQRDDLSKRDWRALRERLDMLQNRGYLPGFESLARVTAAPAVSVLDHARGLAVVVDEPAAVDEELARAWRDVNAAWQQSGDRILPPPAELFLDPADATRRLEEAALFLQELAGEEPAAAARVVRVATRRAPSWAGRLGDLAADLEAAAGAGRRSVCLLRAEGAAGRLREILDEYGVPHHRLDARRSGGGGLLVGVAGLRQGFEFPDEGLAVLSERDLFGEKRKATATKTGSRAAFISDFRDLKPGDMVVHTDHGVARFAGLGRPRGGSLNRDFMVLEFSGGDRLFVPVDRLDLVQKYSGVAGSRPSLDRLGGPGWERVKSRVRTSVQSMAKDLLELYARRRAARGYAFSADTPWQAELEGSFPFELTPDQQRALAEVKGDMESSGVMDRLLVGDVGFGKTEVAVRAAFKAVMDGRQVAILAPTTVLAMQHFETLRERYAPFPVRVEVVSRFRSAAETRAVLQDLAVGAVDVLIGTHRLLSKDVRFKQLGLLVVDEEQRFGVAHKERLKKMSIGIDILSMTATPIPRTLQMSLAGVRDLSVIETPPPGRTAIQTHIVPFRTAVLAQAIRQELRRGGQVFMVHNRVETLHAVARAVQEMVPDARLAVAHGQMRERELERAMLRFMHREADVLVTTTIVENGLDIPGANTIIVNRADRFGLAQLYQLRGRVGRSHQHAYAYFVVPGRQAISEEARRRLTALQEFSELGSGFRLAAADLEIRGAGELLGSRQHGHIASLGFDLYCQMLERAVQELRGEPVAERRPVSLHLGVDIKVPESYLRDAGDRLVLYKRLAQASDVADVDRLAAETEDRYGHPPAAARNLFGMGRLRLSAERLGVKSMDLVDQRVHIRFHDEPPVETADILDWAGGLGGSPTPGGVVILPGPPSGQERIAWVAAAIEGLLGRLGDAA